VLFVAANHLTYKGVIVEQAQSKKKILIVDDDDGLRKNLAEVLSEAGYETRQAPSGREAVDMAADDDFDVVLLDLIMPKMSGSDVLVELKRVSPRSKVIMITAFASIENAVDAIKRGAADYLSKPFKIDDLLMRVMRALEEARLDLSSLTGDFDSVLGSLSNPIRRTITQLLAQNNSMRLMEVVRALGVDDHTKVLFHLRMLKDAGIVAQSADRAYVLGSQGTKALDCLKVLEKYFR
jgi:DNA-binding NtrC family response regulator